MSDFDRVFLRKPELVASSDDDFDDAEVDEASTEPPPASGREGLPSTFRMRADSHYVDLLAQRAATPPVQLIPVGNIHGGRAFSESELGRLVESVAAHGIVQPLLVRRRQGRYELIAGAKRLAAAVAAGLREVPCLLREADDEGARALARAENLHFEAEDGQEGSRPDLSDLPARAAREIVDSLATIESCLNLFLDRERPLRERVAVNLVRAEAHRARWLAEAYGLLGSEPTVAKKPVNLSSLAGRLLQEFEAEARLSNVELALTIDEPAQALVGDERLLSAALTGAAGAMLRLLQNARGAVLKVRVSAHPATRQLAIQYSQDLVAAPDSWRAGLAGQGSNDGPAGRVPSLGLAVASHVMQLHGGHVELDQGPRGGCSITLSLPASD